MKSQEGSKDNWKKSQTNSNAFSFSSHEYISEKDECVCIVGIESRWQFI